MRWAWIFYKLRWWCSVYDVLWWIMPAVHALFVYAGESLMSRLYYCREPYQIINYQRDPTAFTLTAQQLPNKWWNSDQYFFLNHLCNNVGLNSWNNVYLHLLCKCTNLAFLIAHNSRYLLKVISSLIGTIIYFKYKCRQTCITYCKTQLNDVFKHSGTQNG